MKVISHEDMYISSTWGASIRLYADQEKEVGDDMGLLALQAGAKRVEDSPLRSPSLIAREEEKVEDAEIVVEVEDNSRSEKLEAAIQQIIDNGDPKDFTTDGMPKQSVIKKVFGEQVTSEERDETWAKLIVE